MDISREELFELIWEKPTVEVARDMGISDVAVAKLCARTSSAKTAPRILGASGSRPSATASSASCISR